MKAANERSGWAAGQIAFRVLACYLALYALCSQNGTVWRGVPLVGAWLEAAAAMPFHRMARWVGQHWLHLQGLAAQLHATGYNDRALDYVGAAAMAAFAVAAAAVWTVLDRGRPATRAFPWLRWLLRMTMAVAMLMYGIWKVADVQISPPSLAMLNTPIGQTSAYTMVWATLGLNATYERITGAVEVLCAVLLFYRRTALSGVLLTVVVMSNVLLFDWFFDIPLKLYSATLLVMCAVVAAPDAVAMVRFFVQQKPATPSREWAPRCSAAWGNRALVAAEVVIAVTVLWSTTLLYGGQRRELDARLAHPSALAGQWHVEGGALAAVNGQPVVDLFFGPDGYVTARGADGRLWEGTHYDDATRTAEVLSTDLHTVHYRVQMLDASHLLLTPGAGTAGPGAAALRLTRVPLPAAYPLFERHFSWAVEWPFER